MRKRRSMSIDSNEWARLVVDVSTPKEIVVDQSTGKRLEDLCSQMTDTCGLIEATLQLAVEHPREKRDYIKTALSLSARGTRSIKIFLSEWNALVEESRSRENSERVAEDSAGTGGEC
jgi:hypothetical protein